MPPGRWPHLRLTQQRRSFSSPARKWLAGTTNGEGLPVVLETKATVEDSMTDEVEPMADLDATDERGISADLVRAYLNGIGRTRLLTAVEEVTLSKRIEAGLY